MSKTGVIIIVAAIILVVVLYLFTGKVMDILSGFGIV